MEKNDELLLILILIVVLVILAISIYFYLASKAKLLEKEAFIQKSLDLKELQVQNLQAINETLEMEREKFATSIQDEIDPLLVTLQLNIGRYKKDFLANRLRIEDLDYCQQFVDSVVMNLRATSNSLAPQKKLQYGLSNALHNHFKSLENSTIHFSSTYTDSRFLSKNQILNLYHICVELAISMCKCDSPAALYVRLEADESDVLIFFSHDKSVLNLSVYPTKYSVLDRYALDSIQARMSIINAKVYFEKQDSGTSVVVKVPLY